MLKLRARKHDRIVLKLPGLPEREIVVKVLTASNLQLFLGITAPQDVEIISELLDRSKPEEVKNEKS